MKLKDFLGNKFSKNILKQKQYPQILDTCLGDCLDYMFPGEGFVHFYLRDVMRDIKKVKVADIRPLFQKSNDSRNLIFHIRDDAWLATHLQTYIQRFTCPELENLGTLSLETIQKFVATSPVFNAKRCEFEQHIIKSYISECLDCRCDDFYSRSIEKILETGSANYDKLFRSRVINAMNFLGVDRFKTEEGLEINAGLWRQKVMGLTFANRYPNLKVTYSQGRTFQIPHEDVVDTKSAYHKYVNHRNVKESYLLPREDLQDSSRAIYDNWMCLREYEYYQEHKRVIDQLGTATKNMKTSPKTIKKIATNLANFEKQNLPEMVK